MLYNYMIKVYAYLVRIGYKNIEDLPEEYRLPVAEYLAGWLVKYTGI